jgi:molecular chaperone Hsp33
MANEAGRFLVALACERRVRVKVVVLHGPARELCERHGLVEGAAVLAGEGLVAAALLSAHIKGEERLTLRVEGSPDLEKDGLRFLFTADVDGDGAIRGRFAPTSYPRTSVFDAIFSVIKSVGPKEVYRGHTTARQESFEAALQRYFNSSEQVDGRVRILAEADETGLRFAAGMLVERLPEMPTEDFGALLDQPMRADFRGLMTQVAFGQLGGSPLEILDWRDYHFHCGCSRARVIGMLRGLGAEVLKELLTEQGQAEVTCQYCRTVQVVEGPELQALITELEAGAPGR